MLSNHTKKNMVIHQIYFYQYLKYGFVNAARVPKSYPYSYYLVNLMPLFCNDYFSPDIIITAFDKAVLLLDQSERQIIFSRYFLPCHQYECYFQLKYYLSERSYYRIKDRALNKLFDFLFKEVL